MFRIDKEYKDIVLKYDTEYYVEIDNVRYPVHSSCLNVTLPCKVYSLPSNNVHEVNTMILLRTCKYPDTVANYWGKYKVNSKVKGTIRNGFFYIK